MYVYLNCYIYIYIYPEDIYNNIIKNYPKPYQSWTRIIKLNNQKHALYGRRVKNSMLCNDVRNFDWYGKIVLIMMRIY